MKLRKIYMPSEVIKGKTFPLNTVMITLNTGVIITSTDFHHKRTKPLLCNCYLPKTNQWIICYVKNEFTEAMWNFYRQTTHNPNKKYKGNYERMMRHSRKKKTGSSGSKRENKKAITDYECSKNPLFDFRRVYN